MDCRHLFEGKRITVLGLGLLGRGVGDAEFLAQQGAQVIVTDKKSEVDLVESIERLKRYPNITFHLDGHPPEDFSRVDMIIKAAGVPLDSPEIALAHKNNVPVAMSTALFAKYAMEAGATIIGITGTRGKSTTTHMIYEVLKATAPRFALERAQQILIGGNIRGVSTLAMLPEVNPSTIAVLELDSWQLQGFGDLKISPQIAVFANLMPDHKNYYPDMDAYFADKANIFRFQKDGDTLIVGKSIEPRVVQTKSINMPLVPEPIPEDWHLKIPGDHNRENASFAAASLRALGLSEEEIKKGIESFEGVEGRLQFVREINGIKIYNDNNSTTPEATIAALRAFDDNKNIILIMGGADKGLDMSTLLTEAESRTKALFLLAGSGTERIKENLPDAHAYDSLETVVHAAFGAAASGDVLLFSPAFASFGMFKNEYDRGDQFMALIRSIS